ncbi:MAG: glycosyltransferase [Ignavibacteriales bacterium]|nr:glycosyltransferase [Ignavibacteriales bacterium]
MIENRKNIFGILKVADKVKEVNKDVGFILVGKFGYGSEKIIYEINKRENVTHLSNVDDELLKKLYNISNVFLFPSFYEGFGYPPLEAMQCGLPVIASDNTSLSEVVGVGGLLHNPNDYEGMTKDILKLLSDDQFYNKISQQGIEQAKKFNLEKTAQQIVNIFNSLDAEKKKKMNNSKVNVSIVIITWQMKDLLQKCLETIYKFTEDISFEVIVIDNNSTDGTSKMIEDEFNQVKLIKNSENRGVAPARNQGIKETNGDYILILDADMELIDNSIFKLYKFMEENPSCGLVGSKLVDQNLLLQTSCKKISNTIGVRV